MQVINSKRILLFLTCFFTVAVSMAEQIINENTEDKYMLCIAALVGLRITSHRITMMQNANGEESPVTINDLVEPNGQAASTKVVVKMPVIE